MKCALCGTEMRKYDNSFICDNVQYFTPIGSKWHYKLEQSFSGFREHIYLLGYYLYHGPESKLSNDDTYYRSYTYDQYDYGRQFHLPKSIMNKPNKILDRIKNLVAFL